MNCEECGALVLTDTHRGEAVCTNCSLVAAETAFDFQEPRGNEEPREATTLNAGFPQTRMFNDSRDAGGALAVEKQALLALSEDFKEDDDEDEDDENEEENDDE